MSAGAGDFLYIGNSFYRSKSLTLTLPIAPALEAAVPFHPVKFNGTFNYPSAFRGPPSPEVDAAWETLVNRQSGQSLSES